MSVLEYIDIAGAGKIEVQHSNAKGGCVCRLRCTAGMFLAVFLVVVSQRSIKCFSHPGFMVIDTSELYMSHSIRIYTISLCRLCCTIDKMVITLTKSYENHASQFSGY
jgi:hypothetical protein